jgi:signal transduction histidine kinase
MERNAGAAFNTLESLLIWSKNDLVKLTPDFKQVDVIAIIEELLNFFQDAIDLRQMNVIKDFCDGNAFIEADENMLKTSLRNVLSNAIKFSNDGGNIWIRVYLSGDNHVVEIEDAGVGMDETTLENLFNYNKVQEKGEKYSGQGARIGLMLAKEFLDKNNAVVTVESEIGKGTKFVISIKRFPLRNE